MRLSPHAAVPRVWTVELRPHAPGPVLGCLRCTPRTVPLQGTTAQTAALRHLAAHARSDAVADYLRTCQCRQRGCRWHARHRGCAGSVLLVLSRDHGGRNWRLADVCAACARAIPNAAVVPDTTLPASAPAPRADDCAPQPTTACLGPSPATRVQEMLTYLAAALPACTSAAARLVAMQCALRANSHGRVLLPYGVLRGMRLGHSLGQWRELERAAWLRPAGAASQGTLGFDLFDPAVLTQAPGRRARGQAADWALRQTCHRAVRSERAVARLVTLQLAARTLDHGRGCAEVGHLTRAVGLSSAAMATLLDQLASGGALRHWRLDTATDEVHWTLTL